jgi:pimeloyl-ACP methyl ester carboxylesterase
MMCKQPSLFKMLKFSISFGNADQRQTFDNLVNTAALGDDDHLRQYYNYSLQYNCTDRLFRLQLPVLVLCGGNDPSFQRYAKIISFQIPHSDLRIIKGASHQLPTKWGARTNEIIRNWLERQLHMQDHSQELFPPASHEAIEESEQFM